MNNNRNLITMKLILRAVGEQSWTQITAVYFLGSYNIFQRIARNTAILFPLTEAWEKRTE